jgi:uncharacterized protein (TIGR03437 family)
MSHRRYRTLSAVLGFLAATPILSAQTGILGKNLIANGDAESGVASADGTAIVPNIPSWTRGAGSANVLAYANSKILLTDPAPPDHGFNYFAGNSAGKATLTQTIDVSSAASLISAGNVKYNASAYLGNTTCCSAAQVDFAFQNSNGQTFNTATVSSAYYTEPGLSIQQSIGLVPSGTTRIMVTLTLNNPFGAADDVSLVLSALGTSPGSVLGTNLVVNPGAEAGPNAPSGSIALYIPGWASDVGASVQPYGQSSGIALTDPGPADRGVSFFVAQAPLSDMYQDIDVSPAASLIDAGQVTYAVSAWLGATTGGGSPTLMYVFYDWSGKQLAATGQLGPVSHTPVGLFEANHGDVLPAGTRRIRLMLTLSNRFLIADNINFTLSAPNAPPVITGGGIVSASAFGAFSAIAPGSWIEIYGANLAPDTRGLVGSDIVNGVLPTTLDGVSVSVGGAAAFIDYVSPGQINVLVPSTAPVASGTVDISIKNANGTSDPYGIYINATEPGLLAPSSFTVGGKQYIAALFQDGQTFALPTGAIQGVPSHPASPGDVLTIYGVGFGPVTGGFTAGTLVTAQNSLTNNFSMSFGPTAATISYDGLAPSFTGLYQFNVVVPKIAANNATPISYTLGNSKTPQTLYIAVQ